MLNRTDIRRECSKLAFSRAEELVENRAVKNLAWEKKKEDGFEIVEIRASVCGSRGNLYDVYIKADEDYREILEYTCECPAVQVFAGLCKHCAAVMLVYLEERSREKTGGRNRGAKTEEAGEGPVPGYPVPSRVQAPASTYGFEELLRHFGLRESAPWEEAALWRKVRLTARFRTANGGMQVEFRIGIGRMYVLKNIGDFVNAVAGGEKVRYGKELEFTHTLESFDASSRPLVRFLVYSLHSGSSFYLNYLSEIYNRELFVDGGMLDGFLESVRKTVLQDESGRICRMREGEPERQLSIRGDEHGVMVKLSEQTMLTGHRYIYFLKEGILYRAERERVEEIREFLLYMDSFGKNGLYIARSELTAFTRDMLPVLAGHFQVETVGYEPETYRPKTPVFEAYLDLPQADFLTCELCSVYGDKKYNLFGTGQPSEQRDVRQERQMTAAVGSFFSAWDRERGQMALSGDKELYRFMKEGLSALQRMCTVYVSDALKGVRIVKSPRVSVGVSLEGNLLEFSLSSGEMELGELVSILSRYDRKRKFYRLKDGSFMEAADDGIAVLARLKQELALPEGGLKKGKIRLPRYRALYLDSSLQEDENLSLDTDQGFRSLVEGMKRAEEYACEIPPELEGVLRGYQKLGFRWIKALRAGGFGGILADDMGLGKTLQIIAFLLSEWKEKKGLYLVVCPASLVYNWKSELERFAPALPVYTAAGAAAVRKEILEQALDEGSGVVVTSYDLLRRDIEWYQTARFAVQVIDEAQYIKNRATQAAAAVKQVPSGFRMALTGTPVENRLSELWSIFDYLMPGFLFSYNRFRQELEAPIVTGQDEQAAARLKRMIRPFVMRRLKQDVLSDLPDKIEKTMYAAMEGEQRELYEAHVQRLILMLSGQTEEEFASSRLRVLAQLTHLRQLCCDPALLYEGYRGGSSKTRLCLELIRSAAEGGHRVLLFSQFTSMLARLMEDLAREGISYYSLDGSTPKEKRVELVEQFNRDETQVFCISLKAGGTGLNLTGADMVIHFDPWWNVAVQNQATDRAHRIGQKKVVTVYRLVARGTIEEKIMKLQEKKKELAEQILGEKDMGMASLTREALMEILR